MIHYVKALGPWHLYTYGDGEKGGGAKRVFCGKMINPHRTAPVGEGKVEGGAGICANCLRTYKASLSRPDQAIEEGRVARGSVIRRDGMVEVAARVFRVKGSRDTYTVTVIEGEDLPATCTCMDGKVRPEVMCKHVVAVRLAIEEEG